MANDEAERLANLEVRYAFLERHVAEQDRAMLEMAARIDRIEARLGKPVISANQALFWAMLDQARIPASGPGRLFQVRTW